MKYNFHFLSQLRFILKKNYLIKIRRPFLFIFELIVLCVVGFMIRMLTTQIDLYAFKDWEPLKYKSAFQSHRLQPIVESCIYSTKNYTFFSKMMFTPQDTGQKFYDWIQKTQNLTNPEMYFVVGESEQIGLTQINNMSYYHYYYHNPTIKWPRSETKQIPPDKTIEKEVFNNANVRPICGIINFDESTVGSARPSVALRFTKDSLATSNIKMNTKRYFPHSGYKDSYFIGHTTYKWYVLTAFPQWQLLLHEFLEQEYMNTSNQKPSGPFTDFTVDQFAFSRFSEFEGGRMFDSMPLAQDLIPLLIMLSSIFLLNTFVSSIISEKEEGLSLLLNIMGISNAAINISWWITYTPIFIISSLLGCIPIFLIIKNADFFVLFTLTFASIYSCASFFMLISSKFGKVDRGLIVAALLHSAATFTAFVLPDGLPTSLLLGLSIFPQIAYSLGLGEIVAMILASKHLTWSNMSENMSGISVTNTFVMLGISFLLFNSLNFITSLIDFRVLLHNFFMLRIKKLLANSVSKCPNTQNELVQQLIQPQPSSSIDATPSVIKIVDLNKFYISGKKVFHALKNFSLNIRKNELLVLLGRNGAGKSTLINILSGSKICSSGSIEMFGYDFTQHHQKNIQIGICFQNNILWNLLTVYEHIEMFVNIKEAISERRIGMADAMKLMRCIGLHEKLHLYVHQLSGGMKRKLCVMLAFLGDPDFVILDEPSTGLDPHSREGLIQFLRIVGQNRCILFSTHSMDEAEMLGDRIAIMSNGKLCCCGTPSSLKSMYNCGPILNITTTLSFDKNFFFKKLSAICGAPFKCIEKNDELRLELSTTSNQKLYSILKWIENEKEILAIKNYGICNSSIESVFRCITDDNLSKEKNDSTGYPASQSFDDICLEQQNLKNNSTFKDINMESNFELRKCSQKRLLYFKIMALLKKRYIWLKRDVISSFIQLLLPAIIIFLGLGILNMIPDPSNTPPLTFDKNVYVLNNGDYVNGTLHYAVTDEFKHFPLGEELSKINNNYWLSIEKHQVSNERPSTNILYMLYKNDTTNYMASLISNIMTYQKLYPSAPFNSALMFAPLKKDPITHKTPLLVYAMGNSSFLHFLPETVHVYTKLYSKIRGLDFDVKFTNNMLPTALTTPAAYIADVNNMAVALLLGIALSFVPISVLNFSITEKKKNLKHFQFICGISPFLYWTTNLFFDMLIYYISCCILYAVLVFYSINDYTSGKFALPFFCVLILYGPVAIMQAYILSFFFKATFVCQIVTLSVSFLSAVIFPLLTTMLSYAAYFNLNSKDIKHLKNLCLVLFSIVPSFSAGDAAFVVPFCKSQSAWHISCLNPFEFDIFGRDIYVLAIMLILEFCILLFLDYNCSYKTKKVFKTILQAIHQKGAPIKPVPLQQSFLQDDTEKSTCDSQLNDDNTLTAADNSCSSVGSVHNSSAFAVSQLQIKNLCKEFRIYKKAGSNFKRIIDKSGALYFQALNNVSFEARAGDIVVLLGPNGAGKSTLFKILTAEILPDSGDVTIDENPLSTISTNGTVGYCSQEDACWDFLNAKEHLSFFGHIRGLSDDSITIDTLADQLLNGVNLHLQAHKQSRALSGGMKRRLCFSIAAFGKLSVILLDEPSSGLDPLSQQIMSECILKFSSSSFARILQFNPIIIISTHSMFEAEKLASSLNILIDGSLVVQGTIQSLKNSMGLQLELEICLAHPTLEECEALKQKLGLGDKSLISRRDVQKLCMEYDSKEESKGFNSGLHCMNESATSLFTINSKEEQISTYTFCLWWLMENVINQLIEYLATRGIFLTKHNSKGISRRFLVTLQNKSIADAYSEICSPNVSKILGKHFDQSFSLSSPSLQQIFNSIVTKSETDIEAKY